MNPYPTWIAGETMASGDLMTIDPKTGMMVRIYLNETHSKERPRNEQVDARAYTSVPSDVAIKALLPLVPDDSVRELLSELFDTLQSDLAEQRKEVHRIRSLVGDIQRLIISNGVKTGDKG